MKWQRWIVGGAILAASMPAHGNGFYIPVQDPFATARGNAWVASADGPAAVYYNPAGLVQAEGASLQAGGYSVYLGLEATTGGTTVESDASWELIPQLYGVLPLNDRWVAGFGINTPFGLATDWPNTGPFRAVATLTELEYVTGWAVVGYRVSDSFSLGGGVGLHHADARLRQGVAPAPAQFQFEGSDQGLSWMVSALWKPHEQHSLGLVYRSHTDFDLDGDVSVTGLPVVPGSLDFMTPATAAIGYAFQPCDQWTFEVNVEWVNWERLNSLRLTPAAIYPGQSLPFHWDSNFIYSAGMTRRFGDGWIVNAGYNYIENSQPDLTFNPAIADADRHWFNVGIGRDYGDISWFLAYQFAYSNRQVTGAAVPLVNGKYKSRFHSVSLNVTWDF